MLKGQKKHIDKEQGKIKHEAPRSVNYRAKKNKNKIGTTALERSICPKVFKVWKMLIIFYVSKLTPTDP